MKIELKNITKSYNSNEVIKGLSYTFESGKIYVIKGVSGCGKTTLLNIIGGIETDFGGEIIKDFGHKISDSSSYIFQSSLLLSNITVLDNLLLIKNNAQEINSLCKELGVTDLPGKFPEQISGGERQRIAIVRALLKEPELLLADEPTASLDESNSVQIAKTLAKLRSDGRIIIIATHEHYFDELADEIIYLKYGTIEKADTLTPKIIEADESTNNTAPETKAKFNSIKFSLKRHPKLLSIGSLLPLVLVFLMIMIVSTIQNNFKAEYLRYIKTSYPMDLLMIDEPSNNNFKYKDNVVIYDNYTAFENKINAYYLLDKKDSVLSIKGMIEFGKFPETDKEIIVSRDFVSTYFSDTNYESHIGKKIVFKNTELTISGVLKELNESDNNKIIFGDTYYRRNIKENAIFIPYITIKEIGVKQDTDFKMGVYDGLMDKPEVIQELKIANMGNVPNQFYANIEEAQRTVDVVTIVLLIILFICYIISCIFMISIIQTELFYRKKELGYLQIFGLPKKNISKIVFSEYFLKITVAFAFSVILYLVAVVLYGLTANNFIFFNSLHIRVIILLLFIVYCSTAFSSIRKFLKRSVVSLIT